MALGHTVPKEPHGFADETLPHEQFYKQFDNPDQIDSPQTMKWWIDSYDYGHPLRGHAHRPAAKDAGGKKVSWRIR